VVDPSTVAYLEEQHVNGTAEVGFQSTLALGGPVPTPTSRPRPRVHTNGSDRDLAPGRGLL